MAESDVQTVWIFEVVRPSGTHPSQSGQAMYPSQVTADFAAALHAVRLRHLLGREEQAHLFRLVVVRDFGGAIEWFGAKATDGSALHVYPLAMRSVEISQGDLIDFARKQLVEAGEAAS